MTISIIRGVFIALAATISLIASVAHGENLVRGPYLQQGAPTSVIVRWRTDESVDSLVRYGSAPGQLNQSVSAAALVTEHELTVMDLAPDTVYFYSAGSSGGALAGDDSEHFFRTSPVVGSIADSRIWVLGDSGTANANAAAVRDAYLNFTGDRGTDLIMMLGDNAYNDGTDDQYQGAVFDMYPQVLRQTPLWSTLGNHDGHTADSSTQSGPYYDIFSFPTQGEVGGVASGTEAYYSFDYANIHFICLESYETDRSADSAMMTWLAGDIASTAQTWVVAFWHHPPYTKGSHDSDSETALIEMRENALPILESYGVDLVLSGHSHSYERSFLIDGHYGNSDSFGPVNLIDGGDGREGSDGVYAKLGGPGAPNAGAVYSVPGSAGKTSGGALDHEAMFISLNRLGSLVIDVNGSRLDGWFVAADGAIDDHFTITKGPDITPPTLADARVLDGTSLLVSFSELVDATSAGDVSNYNLDLGNLVVAAAPQPNGIDVLLTTSPLLQAVDYVLTVSGVADLSGNVIAPDSPIGFRWVEVTTVSLQNGVLPDAGYDGQRDTWLDEGQPAGNNGASTVLVVDGDDGGDDLSSMLAWDVSAIPANATIQSVEMVIDVFNATGSSYGVYEVRRDWLENEASWNQYSSGMNWQLGGAKGAEDRGAVSLATVSASATGYQSTSFNQSGIALVQAWVDGSAPNRGIILADESSYDGLDFYSGESTPETGRPRLVVTYEIPADSDGDAVPDAADNCLLVDNPDQRDTNADGYGNACDADLDNDGSINFTDLGLMKSLFFAPGDLDADLNGDGSVNFQDLAMMKAAFFGAPGPSGVSP